MKTLKFSEVFFLLHKLAPLDRSPRLYSAWVKFRQQFGKHPENFEVKYECIILALGNQDVDKQLIQTPLEAYFRLFQGVKPILTNIWHCCKVKRNSLKDESMNDRIEESGVKKGHKIHSSLFEKIRQLGIPLEASLHPVKSIVFDIIDAPKSAPSTKRETIRDREVSQSKLFVTSKAHYQDSLHICAKSWLVSDKLIVFRRHNVHWGIKECCEGLKWLVDKDQKDKCLVFSHEASADHFARSVPIIGDGYNLRGSIYTINMALYWIKIYPEGKIAIELGHKDPGPSLLAASCILAATNLHKSAAQALNYLIRFNSEWKQIKDFGMVQRYSGYFDTYFSLTYYQYTPLSLHQVILYAPFLKQSSKLTLRVASQKTKTYTESYRDSSFCIYSGLSFYLDGECYFSLTSSNDESNRSTINFQINSAFHQQGVFRMKATDVKTDMNVDSEFFIDLIFVEAGTKPISYYLNKDIKNIISDTFSSSLLSPVNKNLQDELIERGFDRSVSTLCSKLASEIKECEKILERLNKKCTSKTKEVIRVEKSQLQPPLLLPGYIDVKIDDIRLIEELCLKEDSFTRKPLSSRRRLRVLQSVEETKPALRPFHWSDLRFISGTIFEDAELLQVDIDKHAFERLFCRDTSKSNAKRAIVNKDTTNEYSIKDIRRILHVSLSIKHLQRKGINPEDIPKIISATPELLTIDDLKNIKRIVPSPSEKDVLETAASLGVLFPTEQVMLTLSNNSLVLSVVEVLLFEKTYNEETEGYEEFLNHLEKACKIIIESKELRIVFLTILRIGNALNSHYKKQKALGFRLESLKLLSSYAASTDGRNLVTFLLDTLIQNKVDLDLFFSNFSILSRLSTECFEEMSKKINHQIRLYNDVVKILHTMDTNDCNKYLYRIMGIMKNLETISKKYSVCHSLVSSVRLCFSEEKSSKIAYIFTMLKIFVQDLYSEFTKRKKLVQ